MRLDWESFKFKTFTGGVLKEGRLAGEDKSSRNYMTHYISDTQQILLKIIFLKH